MLVVEWDVMQNEEGKRWWGVMQEYLRSGVKGKGKGCRESGREKLLIHIILKKMGVKITIMGENRNLPFKTTMLHFNVYLIRVRPRSIMAIFADMVEKCIEVFMDNFSVFGSSFNGCLANLERVLQRCEETNLVLNWGKFHFMVQEEIMLGHKISMKGIEVDKAKIDVIDKLPPLVNVKGVRSFLGHVGFYRRFIKDFSKIVKPLSNLLNKDVVFLFDEECLKAFNTLKTSLVSAPIITTPDWSQEFERMCDASDYDVEAVLGQRKGRVFHAIYFASKFLNDAQIDVSFIGACTPRIFFINGFLCFLEDEWQQNREGRERGDVTSRRR